MRLKIRKGMACFVFRKENSQSVNKEQMTVLDEFHTAKTADDFFDLYFNELMKLDENFKSGYDGDCDIRVSYDEEGNHVVEKDPFYRYYHQLYLVRMGKSKADNLKVFESNFLVEDSRVCDGFMDHNISSDNFLEEKVDVDPIDLLIEQRDLGGGLVERPEGSTELSTKDILDQGISIDDIEDLIEELGMIEYGFITPEILYLLLYDDDFFEEIANEIAYHE